MPCQASRRAAVGGQDVHRDGRDPWKHGKPEAVRARRDLMRVGSCSPDAELETKDDGASAPGHPSQGLSCCAPGLAAPAPPGNGLKCRLGVLTPGPEPRGCRPAIWCPQARWVTPTLAQAGRPGSQSPSEASGVSCGSWSGLTCRFLLGRTQSCRKRARSTGK